MAYYPQFPIYAYHPMAMANPEVYAMYPTHAGMTEPVYFDQQQAHMYGPPQHHYHQPHGKLGYNNRKFSADSGISGLSEAASSSSRKTSNTSTISNSSIILEEQGNAKDVVAEHEEEELPPMEEPDERNVRKNCPARWSSTFRTPT